MKFFCFVLVLGLEWVFAGSCRCEENRKDLRFFRFDVLSVNQELLMEEFDLGEVYAGEIIKIQLYVFNRTKIAIQAQPDKNSGAQITMNSDKIKIEPRDGALVHVSLTVPKNPKYLSTSFRLEWMITGNCKFIGMFKSKILGVVSFEKDEFICEFEESDEGKITIPISVLLSNVEDVVKLRANCEDSLSFLSFSPGIRDGKSILFASFFPQALDRPQYRGKIFLENKDLSTRCTMNLTLSRKSNFAIFPERIVLKPKPGSSDVVGEAVLRCRNADAKIDSLILECEPSKEDKMTCEVKKINDRIGRIYITLERNVRSVKSSGDDLVLISVDDGSRVQTMFVSIFIAN